jgi:hypothetical protein
MKWSFLFLFQMKHYSNIQKRLWPKTYMTTGDNYQQARQSYQEIVQLSTEAKSYLLNEHIKPTIENSNITELQRMRAKQLARQFSLIVDLLSLLFKLVCKFKSSASNETYKTYINMIVKHSFARIRNLLKQPLSYFPDLSLWLVTVQGQGAASKEEPIGVCL